MLPNRNRLRQLFAFIRLADLNQIQNRITTLSQKFDHLVIIGVNIVVDGIIPIRSSNFLRFAMQSSSNTLMTVFLFDKDRFHPYDLAINTADHITGIFAIYNGYEHRETGRKILFHFFTTCIRIRF